MMVAILSTTGKSNAIFLNLKQNRIIYAYVHVTHASVNDVSG